MSILVNQHTRLLCQGITGAQASFYVERAIAYGTQMVGGVRPGKGGTQHLGLPVFDSVLEAKQETDANASVIFVPKEAAADAIIEAIEAKIDLIVCITEHVPVLDMIRVNQSLTGSGCTLLGPNTPGVITPDECRIGIMPGEIFRRGHVGIISRSSTLTYEVVFQTTETGLGQSTCVGIGGDPIHGLSFTDCLELFEQDEDTEVVVLIGEIGGGEEECAAAYLKEKGYRKPVLAYIAGQYAPTDTRMGHAGAIIRNGLGTAEDKKRILSEAGVRVVESPVHLGEEVKQAMYNLR